MISAKDSQAELPLLRVKYNMGKDRGKPRWIGAGSLEEMCGTDLYMTVSGSQKILTLPSKMR